jgi:hypothetical protein
MAASLAGSELVWLGLRQRCCEAIEKMTLWMKARSVMVVCIYIDLELAGYMSDLI